ncbi:MAG: PD-(D/E)XK nuclease family protein, partial [Pseudomonadota bacterium]
LMTKIGTELFAEALKDFPDQKALWWPRFERLARAYLMWEEGREVKPSARHSEVYARVPIRVDGSYFYLSGEADRIDELSDGTLAIIDFKTGEPPSAKQVKAGLNAQLALEVAMKQRGAFDFKGGLSQKPVSVIGWVKVNGRDVVAPFKPANIMDKKNEPGDTPEELGALAERQLISLIRQYRSPSQGYMSRPRADFETRFQGDYDHLARIKEWQLATEEGGE